jgi:gluconokinase
LWLREEKPAIFKRTDKWLSFSDYIALKLFGVAATNVSMASGTGIFDFRKCDWDAEFLEFLKIEKANLPVLAESDTQTFQVNEAFQKRWRKLKSAKWFLGIGDGAANNIGAGCLTRNEAALMIGTSGAMRVAFEGTPPEKIPNGLWCYRIDRKRVLIGGALSDGGGLYRWLKDNLKLTGTDDEIENEIGKNKPDSHGLTFLPFLAGERSTGYNETASGAILGLHSSTNPVDIVQAALESVAYRFAEIFDRLSDVVQIKEITASGGALRQSPRWTQIICDVLDQKMSLPDTREASSRGAVLLALEAAGKIKDIADLKTPRGRNFKPNRANHKIYRKGRERHEKFYSLIVNRE